MKKIKELIESCGAEFFFQSAPQDSALAEKIFIPQPQNPADCGTAESTEFENLLKNSAVYRSSTVSSEFSAEFPQNYQLIIFDFFVFVYLTGKNKFTRNLDDDFLFLCARSAKIFFGCICLINTNLP